MGILLYEMVTRQKMFEGDAFQVFAKVREADYVPAEIAKSDLPLNVYKILEKALAKDREQRYQNAEEMLSDLEACMHQLSYSSSLRNLSIYMKGLFVKEAEADVQAMQEAEDIDLDVILQQDNTVPTQLEKTILMPEIITPQKGRKRLFLYMSIVFILFFGSIGGTLVYTKDPLLLIHKLQQTSIYKRIRPTSITEPKDDFPDQNNQTEVLNSNETLSKTKQPQVVVTPPDSPKVKNGIKLLKEEKYTEAVIIFEDILMMEPSMSDRVLVLYSNALVGQALNLSKTDPEKAKAILLKAVKLIPGNAQGHFHLARIYTKQKDYTSAIASYQTTIELDPQMPGAYFNLGYIYASKKDYSNAEAMFSRVVELSPPFVDEALYNLALVQKKLGKIQPCIRNLEQAVRVNSKNTHAKKLLRQLKDQSNKKG